MYQFALVPWVLRAFGVFVAVSLVYKVYKIIFRTSHLHSLKGPRDGSFWTGHLAEDFTTEPPLMYERWIKSYGPVLRQCGPLHSPELLTTDLRAVTHVIHRSDIYEKPLTLRTGLSHIVGWGVLLTEGEQHRLQRKALNPAFGPGQIREMTGFFLDKANELKNHWMSSLPLSADQLDGAHAVDALNWYSRATLDIIGLAGFGYSFNLLASAEGAEDEMYIAFRDLFGGSKGTSLFQIMCLFFPFLRSLPLPMNWAVNSAMAVMRRIGNELIADRKERAILDAAQGEKLEHSRVRDILGLLVRANTAANPKERLSDEEILAQIPTFLVAGHETTATLLAWLTYRLCLSPDIQTRLREECEQSPLPSGSSENEPLSSEEFAALNKLPLLDAVVRETLRLHSPVADTLRQATQDDVIPTSRPYVDQNGLEHDSIKVVKGDTVIISTILIHRLEELWGADAKEWKPDRWLYEDGVPAATKTIPGLHSNLLTFLGGSHACIGWTFALYEIKILVHILVNSFNFRLAVPQDDITGKLAIVTRPHVKSQPQAGAQMPIIIERVKKKYFE